MKNLIIYFSRTGNTKKISEEIQKKLNCDIEEINTEGDYNGMLEYMRAGKEASLKKLPAIKTLSKNPADYDLVIIGTPVWAFNMSSPIRTFITENNDKFKSIALFCTQGGTPGSTIKNMAELAGKEPLSSFDINDKEVQQINYESIISLFIKKLLTN